MVAVTHVHIPGASIAFTKATATYEPGERLVAFVVLPPFIRRDHFRVSFLIHRKETGLGGQTMDVYDPFGAVLTNYENAARFTMTLPAYYHDPNLRPAREYRYPDAYNYAKDETFVEFLLAVSVAGSEDPVYGDVTALATRPIRIENPYDETRSQDSSLPNYGQLIKAFSHTSTIESTSEQTPEYQALLHLFPQIHLCQCKNCLQYLHRVVEIPRPHEASTECREAFHRP